MTTITDVRIRKILTEGKLRAIVSITLNEDIAIHDVKIIQGENRFFVSMPSKKNEQTGVFQDLIHPIYPELREKMEKQIIEEYERYIETAGL